MINPTSIFCFRFAVTLAYVALMAELLSLCLFGFNHPVFVGEATGCVIAFLCIVIGGSEILVCLTIWCSNPKRGKIRPNTKGNHAQQ